MPAEGQTPAPLAAPHTQPNPPLPQVLQHWDVFCHVVDNHGDLGVCWRLARQLAARGLRVRLVVDDPRALAWMAPAGAAAAGVELADWASAAAGLLQPAPVVVEAFGCDLPPAYVAAMQASPLPLLWLNLEYLSAEAYVERSHGLPSPRPGGLTTWFFYPGFTPRTGGLLREPGLLARHAASDGDAWLAAQGWARRPGERVVSLFCYQNPAVPALLQRLAEQPTLLLATPGHAQQQVAAAGLPAGGLLRSIALPWLPQDDYDCLLRACDINAVRGEDSLVRALWAGRPLLWQIYPQHDGAHAAKLQAFLQRSGWPPEVAALHWAWNGLGSGAAGPSGQAVLPPWPAPQAWVQAAQRWRDALAAQPDLLSQMLGFARMKACAEC